MGESNLSSAATTAARPLKPIIDEEIPWAEIIPHNPERSKKHQRNFAAKAPSERITLPADYFATSFEDPVPPAQILEVYSRPVSSYNMVPFPFLIGSVLLVLIYCFINAQ